jgi:hypothetical protein
MLWYVLSNRNRFDPKGFCSSHSLHPLLTSSHVSQKYCPSLQVLRLAWCSHVNDDSIDAMLATPSSPGLSHLEELDLSLTGLSDACIPSLARLLVQNASTLKRLDLSATQMTSEGMGRVVWMVRVLQQQQQFQQYRKDDDGSMTTAQPKSSRCFTLSPLSTIGSTMEEALCATGGSKSSASTSSFSAYTAPAAPRLALEHLTLRFLADMTLETVETWFRVAPYLTFLDVTYSGPDGASSMIATTQDHPHLIQLFQERCLVSKTKSVFVKGLLCQKSVEPTSPPPTTTANRSPASSSSAEEEQKDNDKTDTNSLSTYATPPNAA